MPSSSFETLSDEAKIDRVIGIARRLRPVLEVYGSPREVFSACIVLFLSQSKTIGITTDQFFDEIRSIVKILEDRDLS